MKKIKQFLRHLQMICKQKKNIQEIESRDTLKRNNQKLTETKDLYSVSANKYSAKRHAMHIEIINSIWGKSPQTQKNKKPIAFLIGGGTASGKSTLRKTIIEKELIKRQIQAITVDPDELKEYIPEYQSLKITQPKYAASLVHKESLDIAELLLKKLIRNQHPFIYEGTMAKAKKYKKLVKTIKSKNYKVHIYITDIPLNIAKERAAERAKATGRNIPAYIIENTHKLVPRTFTQIKDLVDCYKIYDNQHGLVMIASNHFVEPKLYNDFLKKGKIKP